jgi:hypothetical protein
LNLYRYCKDDPLNRTDPSGLVGCGDWIVHVVNGVIEEIIVPGIGAFTGPNAALDALAAAEAASGGLSNAEGLHLVRGLMAEQAHGAQLTAELAAWEAECAAAEEGIGALGCATAIAEMAGCAIILVEAVVFVGEAAEIADGVWHTYRNHEEYVKMAHECLIKQGYADATAAQLAEQELQNLTQDAPGFSGLYGHYALADAAVVGEAVADVFDFFLTYGPQDTW